MDKMTKECNETEECSTKILILADLYTHLKSTYVAKLSTDGEYIKLRFSDGQTFKITVEEA